MARPKKQSKKLKKKWFKIVAPKIFNNIEIGETLAVTSDQLATKYVTANLMSITKNVRQQNINVKLKVTSIKDNIAITEVIGYQVMPTAIKRFVRRHVDRIDESFIVATSDGVILRLKPMVLTRFNTKNSVKSLLRIAMKSYFITELKKMRFDEFVGHCVGNRIQKDLSKNLNKIYPVRSVTIRRFDVVDSSKRIPVEDSKVVEKTTESTKPTEKKTESFTKTVVKDVEKSKESVDKNTETDVKDVEKTTESVEKQTGSVTKTAVKPKEVAESTKPAAKLEVKEVEKSTEPVDKKTKPKVS